MMVIGDGKGTVRSGWNEYRENAPHDFSNPFMGCSGEPAVFLGVFPMLQCRFDELVELRFIFISGGRCNGLVELRIGVIRIPFDRWR